MGGWQGMCLHPRRFVGSLSSLCGVQKTTASRYDSGSDRLTRTGIIPQIFSSLSWRASRCWISCRTLPPLGVRKNDRQPPALHSSPRLCPTPPSCKRVGLSPASPGADLMLVAGRAAGARAVVIGVSQKNALMEGWERAQKPVIRRPCWYSDTPE